LRRLKMLRHFLTGLALAMGTAALGSESVSACSWRGSSNCGTDDYYVAPQAYGYYAPVPAYGYGQPPSYVFVLPPTYGYVPPPFPIYGYGPAPAYGYAHPPSYGYAPSPRSSPR